MPLFDKLNMMAGFLGGLHRRKQIRKMVKKSAIANFNFNFGSIEIPTEEFVDMYGGDVELDVEFTS